MTHSLFLLPLTTTGYETRNNARKKNVHTMQLKIGICSRLTCTNTLGGRVSSLIWMKNKMPRREMTTDERKKKVHSSDGSFDATSCNVSQAIPSRHPSVGKTQRVAAPQKAAVARAQHSPASREASTNDQGMQHSSTQSIASVHETHDRDNISRFGAGVKIVSVCPAHKTSPSNPSTTLAVQSFIACSPFILFNIQKRKQERGRGCFAHPKINSSRFCLPNQVPFAAHKHSNAGLKMPAQKFYHSEN